MEKRKNSLNTTAYGAKKRLVMHVRFGCGSLSITTSVSLLANEFDVRSVLHWQVSLAAVNQIYVIDLFSNIRQACHIVRLIVRLIQY